MALIYLTIVRQKTVTMLVSKLAIYQYGRERLIKPHDRSQVLYANFKIG